MSTIKSRLRLLEKIINKLPPLILQCYECPDDAQLAEIAKAEAAGRRLILFGNHYSWVWISGAVDKPWLEDNTDYNYVRG